MRKTPAFAKRRGSRSRYKQNAMGSITWYLGFVEALFVTGVLTTTIDWVRVFCSVLMVLCLTFYGAVYVYFMVNDRDRLQSEAFNLESQELTMLSDIGGSEAISVTSVTGPLALTDGGNEPAK